MKLHNAFATKLWEQTEKENEKDNENAQEQTIAYVHLEKGM